MDTTEVESDGGAAADDEWPPRAPPGGEWLNDILVKLPGLDQLAEEDDHAPSARDQLAEVQQAFERSIPEHYAHCVFERAELLARIVKTPTKAYRDHPIEDPVMKALQNTSAMRMLFFGPPGSGKTTLAVAAARARGIDLKRGAFFVTASFLANARNRGRLGDGDPHPIDECMRTGLLVIDDLAYGYEPPSSPIQEVIHHRHGRNLPTWITTGLYRAQLSERYGGGTMRRITERSVFVQCGDRPDETTKPKGTSG